MNAAKIVVSILLAGSALWCDLADIATLNARGMSLGGAVTTLGADGNAVCGNPALLSVLAFPSVDASSGLGDNGFENEAIFNANAHAVLPFVWGGLGAGFSGEFNTIASEGKSGLLFGDYRFRLAAGFRTPIKMLQVGVGLSLRLVSIDATLAEGLSVKPPPEFNADLGFFSSPVRYLAAGLVFSDLLGIFGNAKTDARRPPSLRLGLGTRNPIFLGELCLEYLPTESSLGLALGLEKWFFSERLRLSLGAKLSGAFADFTPSAGVGMRLGRFTADYAFSYPVGGSVRSGDHRFTLSAAL
ncbi:MAG: hypothetical protein JNM63_02410 [Spirochaetia bacterium]|nr:hypothetical protein [Spirochaetia bacterium]